MPESTYYDPNEMGDETDPLHTILIADGVQWRAQASDTSTLARHLEMLRQQKQSSMIAMTPTAHPPIPTQAPRPIALANRWSAMLVAGVVLIVVITAVVFARSRQEPGAAPTSASTVAATSTVAAMPTVSPVIVTTAGISISFDGIDANPIRTAVYYHFITKPLTASERYNVQISTLRDSQQHMYVNTGGNGISNPTTNNIELDEIDFVPVAPTQIGAVTFTFQITTVVLSTVIPGPWTYTATVTPTRYGERTFASSGVTAHGVTITPIAADWIKDGNRYSHNGLHVQLALSGLPSATAQSAFYVPTKYYDDEGGNNSQIDNPASVIVKLPNGKLITIPSVFENESGNKGEIGVDGKALVDIVFQDIVVNAGDTIQLTLQNLQTIDLATPNANPQTITGTWILTLHL